MKKIFDIKPGDWILAERPKRPKPGDENKPCMQDYFSESSAKTVYGWRAKEKAGIVPVGHFPRSKKIGAAMYVHKQSLLDFLNRSDLDEAS
jgi:hypothetical protein